MFPGRSVVRLQTLAEMWVSFWKDCEPVQSLNFSGVETSDNIWDFRCSGKSEKNLAKEKLSTELKRLEFHVFVKNLKLADGLAILDIMAVLSHVNFYGV